MNVKDFSYLLQHPDKVVSPVQTNQLEEILKDYPYFQAARALHLKGLKNLNSFKYNNALKVAASYTTDRDVLFDYITSEYFSQNAIADAISGKHIPSTDNNLEPNQDTQEKAAPEPETATSTSTEEIKDVPLPRDKADADTILDPELFTPKNVDHEVVLPPDPESAPPKAMETQASPKKEKYSFAQWLELTSPKWETGEPISQTKEDSGEFPLEKDVLKSKKFDLIDKFIASSPKIVPKENPTKVNISESVKIDKEELMTVTLAKVYLEQKKYKKAIQAYKILSLKYPEKSGFFADRIKAVKKLQKENKTS